MFFQKSILPTIFNHFQFGHSFLSYFFSQWMCCVLILGLKQPLVNGLHSTACFGRWKRFCRVRLYRRCVDFSIDHWRFGYKRLTGSNHTNSRLRSPSTRQNITLGFNHLVWWGTASGSHLFPSRHACIHWICSWLLLFYILNSCYFFLPVSHSLGNRFASWLKAFPSIFVLFYPAHSNILDRWLRFKLDRRRIFLWRRRSSSRSCYCWFVAFDGRCC